MTKERVIYLYTDGASRGNPGPGGWAAILSCGPHRKELSGGFRCTTNNRMELLAVIRGLEAIRWPDAVVEGYSDSSLVVNSINAGWKRKKNLDLWARFDAARAGKRLTMHWVKGHNGHPENERCDQLAVAASQADDLPEDTGHMARNEETTLL
ncbi:MAG: ribonuclease HI [Bacteroidales bacterium]|nr:ribonuclease HI [Bacteroidales bacterium]